VTETPVISIVIPVFNSADLVEDTVDEVRAVLGAEQQAYEIVLVDDGSADDSWQILSRLATDHSQVTAIRLLRNYGQHNANLCGLRATSGEWIITMDDDGQNPPEGIALLLSAATEGGHDVVFGRFEVPQKSFTRRLGSRAIDRINTQIFGKPPGLAVSNFRILHRRVVDRITASTTTYPYMTGQALRYSTNPGNVDVTHRPRSAGESSYTIGRILRLVFTILFSYSAAPVHVMAVAGLIVSIGAFALGTVYLVNAIFSGSDVQGWASVAILLAFLNGVAILMLSMLAEYTVRILNQLSDNQPYQVAQHVGSGR
jgi:glycosyltransferase involved in cell wall biosynthesis